MGVTQRKSGALAAQPNSTTLYCGASLRQPRFWAFFGLFCLFGPFRQKRRFFGRAATKPPVRPPSAMVLEVFESARRPKRHVTAGLRHVRRLESARTPKKAPPSARGAISKRVVFNARSAVFGVWVCFTDLWEYTPRSLFWVDQNPEPHARRPPKTADLQKNKKRNRPAESN